MSSTMDQGIGRWIQRRSALAPDAPAIVHGRTVLTYAELATRTRRLANALLASGVGRGDRVVWLGDNHPAFLELLFATAQLGAVFAPVNHRLDHDLIAGLVGRYDPAAIVVGPAATDPSPAGRGTLTVGAGGGRGSVELEHLLGGADDRDPGVEVGLDDVCLMPHTSGTTGAPKGVMLTHGNVTWNAVNLLSLADLRSDDTTMAIAPLFRSGGTGVNVLPLLFKGGTVVVPEAGDPGEILALIERHSVTVGFANPDLLERLVHHERWAGADLSTIRFFLTGGAPVPERLVRTYQERGITFLEGYGLSEAAPLVSILDGATAREKVGAAGRPPLFVDVRLAAPGGRTAETPETGELLVRGPNVMAGYWRDPEATQRAIDGDGWLHTGDAARRDADGDLWIVGRFADAQVVDGELVHPGDVERVLMDSAQVVDAAVVFTAGRPAAFVVPGPGSTVDPVELLRAARRRLPDAAVPESVRVVEQLPRSSVGKLLRERLVAQLAPSVDDRPVGEGPGPAST